MQSGSHGGHARPDDFSVEDLRGWKAERETKHEAALSRLREITPAALQHVLTPALKDRDERAHSALLRLEASDAEAAQLLRNLVDEMANLRQSRYPASGVTESFTLAANRLSRVFGSGLVEQFTYATRRLPDR